jgi:hypothetical protein
MNKKTIPGIVQSLSPSLIIPGIIKPIPRNMNTTKSRAPGNPVIKSLMFLQSFDTVLMLVFYHLLIARIMNITRALKKLIWKYLANKKSHPLFREKGD